jgi:hypothetical protein
VRFGTWSVRRCIGYCAGDKMEMNELDGACSVAGGGERRVQGVGGDTGGTETTGENQA